MLTRERQIELMELALDHNTKLFDFVIACLKEKIGRLKVIKDAAEDEYWEEELNRDIEKDFDESAYGVTGNPLHELSEEELDFILLYMPPES